MNEDNKSRSSPFIYVVLNGELKMSPGKAAAQTAHAVAMLQQRSLDDFVSSNSRTVIVLEATNSEQIKNLNKYLEREDVDSDYYIDEGYNEVGAYSVTALAAYVGESEKLRNIFISLPLYGGYIAIHRTEKGMTGEALTVDSVIVPSNLKLDSKLAFRKVKKAANESL